MNIIKVKPPEDWHACRPSSQNAKRSTTWKNGMKMQSTVNVLPIVKDIEKKGWTSPV